MRVLITGVTGQDGAYLSHLLLSRGYKVTGTSPRRSDDGKSLWRLRDMGVLDNPNFTHDVLDVTCSTSVNNILLGSKHPFDQVYNLAAQSFVAESFNSPIATTTIGYLGVLNLLECIRNATPTTRFYQASTSEMFGLVTDNIQNELSRFHPRSPYATAKAAAHYAVQQYREAYGIFACSGILFNHESPFRGIEFVTRKITDGLAQIVAGKAEHITLGNLDTRRDWGHASDYVRAMNLMLEAEEPEDYVVATGVSHSIDDVLRVAFSHLGMDHTPYIKQDERYMRPSEVPALLGDATRAREKLAWAPVITFENMICEMVDFDLFRHGVDPIELLAERG